LKATSNILTEFDGTSLKEMDEVKLMNRTDTKFVFNKIKLEKVLSEALTKYKLLEINGERLLEYKTLYHDTKDFKMFVAHQNGKLNRYKIRQREYLISNISFLEIKFKSNKGKTIKRRIKRKKIQNNFSEKAKLFINENSPFEASDLEPKLINEFSRLTLVHRTDKERVTIDLNLRYSFENTKKELPFLAIAEVKQEGSSKSSDIIKILKANKIYPSGMTKYGIGIVLVHKNIKYNSFKTKLLTLKKIANDSDDSLFSWS